MRAKRALSHPRNTKLVAYLAERCAVTPERFLEVVAARKAFVKAKFYRKRSRRRSLDRNARAAKRIMGRQLYAGMGELHELLAVIGWTTEQFCDYAGIHRATFNGWRGHPMSRWPVELLRLRIHADRMAAALAEMGKDPDSYLPENLPKRTDGRYPRKAGQLVVEGKPLADYSPWKARR